MTYPRLILIAAIVIAAAITFLTLTEPAHNIPNNRPAEYYPTTEPSQEDS